VCALCQQQTNLQSDNTLQYRKPDASFLSTRDTTPLSFSSVENLEQKMAQLKTPSEAIMPRNIKLLQEYDYSIGKEGKSLIPAEHGGMLSYGTIDSMDTSLSKWDAMIIGPQEVCSLPTHGEIVTETRWECGSPLLGRLFTFCV